MAGVGHTMYEFRGAGAGPGPAAPGAKGGFQDLEHSLGGPHRSNLSSGKGVGVWIGLAVVTGAAAVFFLVSGKADESPKPSAPQAQHNKIAEATGGQASQKPGAADLGSTKPAKVGVDSQAEEKKAQADLAAKKKAQAEAEAEAEAKKLAAVKAAKEKAEAQAAKEAQAEAAKKKAQAEAAKKKSEAAAKAKKAKKPKKPRAKKPKVKRIKPRKKDSGLEGLPDPD